MSLLVFFLDVGFDDFDGFVDEDLDDPVLLQQTRHLSFVVLQRFHHQLHVFNKILLLTNLLTNFLKKMILIF